MPRIPLVKNYSIFKDFSLIGEKLLQTHQEYDSAKKFKIQIEINSKDKNISSKDLYKINKIKIIQNKDKSFSTKLFIMNIFLYQEFLSKPINTKLIQNLLWNGW